MLQAFSQLIIFWGSKRVLKVGDLVQEVLPLMAGDAVARMGILLRQSSKDGTVKVLFGSTVDLMPHTNIKKIETN
jgi:hypothetical protein